MHPSLRKILRHQLLFSNASQKKETGQINLWNIWKYIDGRVDVWIGNAGLIVEQEDEGIFLFRYSSGIGDIDFDDLVYRLILM